MVTENDVKTCMKSPAFEKLDEIHCGLDDGMNTIDANLKRMERGKGAPISRQVDFFKCALDNIDGALTEIAASRVPGFGSVDMEGTLRRTGAAMSKLQAAERRGNLTASDKELLGEIANEVEKAQKIAFDLRAKQLHNCLL
jgi:hypothetical protein